MPEWYENHREEHFAIDWHYDGPISGFWSKDAKCRVTFYPTPANGFVEPYSREFIFHTDFYHDPEFKEIATEYALKMTRACVEKEVKRRARNAMAANERAEADEAS